jgi:hypothetical protein
MGKRTRRPRRPTLLEPLEQRILLSTFVWENMGGPNGTGEDSDNFQATYGSMAATARAVVVAAMDAWEKVIVDFNYQDVEPEYDNTFFLDIIAEPLDGARGETVNILDDDDDKPFAAAITMDDDGGGAGWYFDPTPGDSAEFSNPIDGDMAMGGPPGADFFRTILHEIGHCVGIGSPGDLLIGDYLTDAGVDQVALNDGDDETEGDLYLMQLPGSFPTITFTDAGGLHVYEGPLDPAFPGLPIDTNDLMNSGRTVGNSTRQLISNLDAGILSEAYGYTVALPSSLPNMSFFAHLDLTTGILRVNGADASNPDDLVVIEREGDFIGVNVTGPELLFPFAQVTQILVDLSALADGDDTLSIDFAGGNPIPTGGLTYNGGSGNDRFVVSAGGQAIVVDDDVLTVGGIAVDYSLQSIEEMEVGSTDGPLTARVDGFSSVLDTFTVSGTSEADIIDLEETAPGVDVLVAAGGEDDTIYLSFLEGNLNGLGWASGSLAIQGGDGHDSVEVFDWEPDFGTEYTLLDGLVLDGRLTRGSFFEVEYDGFEELALTTTSGDDTVEVRSTVAGTETRIETLGGDDLVRVDSNGVGAGGTVDNVRSLLIVDGGGGPFVGTDTLILGDRSDSSGDVVTVTATAVGGAPGDSFFGLGGSVRYAGISDLRVDLGGGGDVVSVASTTSGTDVTIAGGRGTDVVTVAAPPDPSAPPHVGERSDEGTVDGIRSIVNVLGEEGNDRLTVIDTSDTTGDVTTVTNGSVGAAAGDTLFGPGGALLYSSLASLRVNLGAGDDDVAVASIQTGTTTVIRSGKGDDEIVVRAADGTVNAVRAGLTIMGEAGFDTLRVDDAAEGAASVVTITGNQVGAASGNNYFGVGGSLTYGSLEQLTVRAGSGPDTLNVQGTAKGTDVAIEAGGGHDVITVDSNGALAGGTVDLVRSHLLIDGGAGTGNALGINDTSDLTADTMTLTATQIGSAAGDSFFGAGGRLTYQNLQGLGVLMGAGGDAVTIRSTLGTTNTGILAGDGNDTIAVDDNGAAAGGTVDGVQGFLSVLGGAGVNVLTLQDASDLTADQVSMTATGAFTGTVGQGGGDTFFGPGGKLVYTDFAAVSLRLGDAEADVVVATPSPSPAGTALFVTGGGAAAGDTLVLMLDTVTDPTVTVLGPAIGLLTSTSHAAVGYLGVEILDAKSGPGFDLVLDMNSALLGGNDGAADVSRAFSGQLAGVRSLHLEVNGAAVFAGREAAVASLTVLGSADADTFAMHETADGLPMLAGVAPGAHANATFLASGRTPTNVSIHFDGGPGAALDQYELVLQTPHDVAYFADVDDTANSGNVNVDGVFSLSFESLSPLLISGAGGSMLIDATGLGDMSELAVRQVGRDAYEVRGDGGFETTVFSGFDRVNVSAPRRVKMDIDLWENRERRGQDEFRLQPGSTQRLAPWVPQFTFDSGASAADAGFSIDLADVVPSGRDLRDLAAAARA